VAPVKRIVFFIAKLNPNNIRTQKIN